MRVVVCGGGAIGSATAFYLARDGLGVIVLERLSVACAASGKAGGFLARDWCDDTPLEELVHRSFDLHTQLPREVGGEWGFRRLTTYQGFAAGQSRSGPATGWTSSRVTLGGRIGSPETTALVHPAEFTRGLMSAAQRLGAELRIGEVTGLAREGASVRGVCLGSEVIEADAVVIALGPWSLLASAWVPLPAVYADKGHSMLYRTGEDVPPEALFLEYREPGGAMLSPEIFPRADGTTYISAISRRVGLPAAAEAVGPDAGAIERLEALSEAISPVFTRQRIVLRQACCRPSTRDGLPLIGAVAGTPGVYVATGHSVWGILNAPATGEAMAELIAHGTSRHVDLAPFDPGRMRPFDPAHLRQ